MKKIKAFRLIEGIVLLLYPFFVFIALQKRFSMRLMSLFLLGAAFLVFFRTGKRSFFIAICGLAALLFCFRNALFLKLYPVLMNSMICLGFFLSLYSTPLVTVFAQKLHYELTPEVVDYTRKATIAWGVFMLINSLVSLVTVFLPNECWVVYNGFVSYCLIGLMFVSERIVRQRSQNAK